MPDSPEGLLLLLKALTADCDKVHCFNEKVGMHRMGNSASSSVTFARHCGQLDMALIAMDIDTTLVHPRVWMKKVFGKVPKDKGDRKRFIRDRMQEDYPDLRATLWSADALAILKYGLSELPTTLP